MLTPLSFATLMLCCPFVDHGAHSVSNYFLREHWSKIDGNHSDNYRSLTHAFGISFNQFCLDIRHWNALAFIWECEYMKHMMMSSTSLSGIAMLNVTSMQNVDEPFEQLEPIKYDRRDHFFGDNIPTDDSVIDPGDRVMPNGRLFNLDNLCIPTISKSGNTNEGDDISLLEFDPSTEVIMEWENLYYAGDLLKLRELYGDSALDESLRMPLSFREQMLEFISRYISDVDLSPIIDWLICLTPYY